MSGQNNDKEINAADHQNDELDEILSMDNLDDLEMPLDDLDESDVRNSDSELPDPLDNTPVEDEADDFDTLDELTLDDFIDESDDPEIDTETPLDVTETDSDEQESAVEADTANEEIEQTASENVSESEQTSGEPAQAVGIEDDSASASQSTGLEADTTSESDHSTEQTDEATAAEETAEISEQGDPENRVPHQPADEIAENISDTSTEQPDDALASEDDTSDSSENIENNDNTPEQQTESSSDHELQHEEDDENALSALFGDRPKEETSHIIIEEPESQAPRPEASAVRDNPTSEPAQNSATDANELEQDIEDLLNSSRDVDDKTDNPANNVQQKEPNIPNKPQPAEAKGGTANKFGLDLNLANSITMSLGLIAVLVAALAVWFGLDASQQTEQLKAGPLKLQKQISQMQEQMDVMQQQIDGLIKVVANKTTENWQKSDTVEAAPLAAKPAPRNPVQSARPIPLENAGAAHAPGKVSADISTSPSAKAVSPQQKNVPVRKAAPAKAKLSSPFEVAAGSVKGWSVNIVSMRSVPAAEAEVRRLRAKDIKAEFVRVRAKGKNWYRVRISGFESEREAVSYKKFLNEIHAIDSWHYPNNKQ
ncbi:sporulation related domain protein [Mariprofundus micogutta]|uniref:Sporulation related domain protein n=1 Tax=Mariprofundus micogutta TaxID=1921010 RepID=A0A1L8CK66_9PROT|nr:SPOR domain-containing protein [Mariprofundus micogutta]GAV19318.1 sporulation related domain protein [Mariprofundus micogutta]